MGRGRTWIREIKSYRFDYRNTTEAQRQTERGSSRLFSVCSFKVRLEKKSHIRLTEDM